MTQTNLEFTHCFGLHRLSGTFCLQFGFAQRVILVVIDSAQYAAIMNHQRCIEHHTVALSPCRASMHRKADHLSRY
jgi:hypothetical protein